MKSTDVSYLLMSKAVNKMLSNNQSEVDANNSLKDAKTKLEAQIKAADDAAVLANPTSVGVTKDKATTRKNLEEALDPLVSDVCALALKNNNQTLYQNFYHSPSDLHNMSGQKIVTYGKALIKEITDHPTIYNKDIVDPADLAAGQTKLTEFENVLVAPRSTVNNQSALNDDFHTKVEDIKPTVQLIKTIMRKYRIKKPVFFNAFKSANKIVDPGSSTTEALVQVIDADSGSPIAGALVTHLASGATATTNAAGLARFSPVQPGDSGFSAEATGYKPGTTASPAHIKLGDETKVTIRLTKE